MSDFLKDVKLGFKNPPVKVEDLLPVCVSLLGISDLSVQQQVQFFLSRDSEIDLSQYFPNLPYILRVCAKDMAGEQAESSENPVDSKATNSAVAE